MKKTKRIRELEYRCRKCGAIFTSGLVTEDIFPFFNLNYSDEELDHIRFQTGTPPKKDDPFRYPRESIYSSHLCDDGSLGLADLIGATKAISEKEYFSKLEAEEVEFYKLHGAKNEK